MVVTGAGGMYRRQTHHTLSRVQPWAGPEKYPKIILFTLVQGYGIRVRTRASCLFMDARARVYSTWSWLSMGTMQGVRIPQFPAAVHGMPLSWARTHLSYAYGICWWNETWGTPQFCLYIEPHIITETHRKLQRYANVLSHHSQDDLDEI